MADERTVTRVLVPLDGSVEARLAVDPALRIAEPLNLPVELVTVYEPLNGRWAEDLDELADRLNYEQVEVSVVGSGWPGEVITEMAAEHPGTLVCMAAQHQDRVDRLALGSVSSHVVRADTAPFLFVGPGYEPPRQRSSYRTLVVGMDGSSRADTAVTVAAVWARCFSSEIELVHVAAPDAEQADVDTFRTHLSEAAERLATEGVSASVTLLRGTDPAERIAELLAARESSLALTVTHGRNELGRLLLGSVTAELLARSPTPVLITTT